MISIKYIRGDATQPLGYGHRVLMHIVNDKKTWGAGFAIALSKRYKEPEVEYRHWAMSECQPRGYEFALGNVQFVDCGEGVTVANMIAQHGIGKRMGQIPLRYAALEECLVKVRERAIELRATVHAPRIGCGIAGGDWSLVSDTIRRELSDYDVPVFIYDL